MRITKGIIAFSLCAVTLFTVAQLNPVMVAQAHHGGRGQHHGYNEGQGQYHDYNYEDYHYYCGGNSAHLHNQGVCPYLTSDTGSIQSSTSDTSLSKSVNADAYSKELTAKVQQILNEKGYDCGEADGICGRKTNAAIMKFQEDNKLEVDGIIGKQVKEALDITE